MTVQDASPIEVDCVAVGQSYFELHHLMHRIVDRTMSCAGLSFARTKVLMRIANEGPMNQATLAGLLGFAPRGRSPRASTPSNERASSPAPRTRT